MKENKDTIYFSYNFRNAGNYFLDGYIEDFVMLRDSTSDDRTRLITNQIKISEQVAVQKNR